MKKNARKLITAVCMLAAAVCLFSLPALAKTIDAPGYGLTDVRKAAKPKGKWVEREKGIRFIKTNGEPVKNRWIKADRKIYYMDSRGYRASASWINYLGNRYYMEESGRLHTGWLKLGDKIYYLRASGIMARGMLTVDGEKYYFGETSGARKTGWVKHGNHRYYFSEKTGAMKTSCWISQDGKYYYVDSSGKMLTSRWLTLDKKEYYLNADGSRATGTIYIGQKGYYFKKNGVYDSSVRVDPKLDPDKPMVALTFDDGPGNYTQRLLNCLEKYESKATFFLVGYKVSSYKKTIKRMAEMKCEIGNHSYSHPYFTSISASSRRYQVTKTNSEIHKAAGVYPTLFRLPYGAGVSNGSVLSSLGLPSIFWSIDTRDWANTGNSQHTVNAVLNYVRDGDIVLMHDVHYATVRAAEKIIPALKKRGYQLVTVSQLAKYKGNTKLKKGRTYYHFR